MNLLSLLAGQTKRDPHALIAIDADPDQPQHVSRSELWRRTLQLRADLATAGVGRGDGVLVVVPAWSSVLDWHVATASLGAYVVCAAPGSSVGELADVLRRVRPRVVAAPFPWTGRETLHEAVRRCEPLGVVAPTVAVVTEPGRVPPVDPSPYDVGAGAWLPSAPTVGMPMPRTHGDELAVAFLPELAAHRESTLVRHAIDNADALGLAGDDVVLCACSVTDPVWPAFAFAAVAAGVTCLLEPSPTAESVLADVTRFGVTHVAADAALARALVDPAARPAKDVSSWRWLGVTGDPAAIADAVHHAERAFDLTATALYSSPGLYGPVALWPSTTAPEVRGRAGGRPVGDGVEVRVVDPATGSPVAPGHPGEIQVRGHVVVDSFLGDPDALPQRRTPDGWFCTGDMGTLAPDGGLRHTGRVTAGSRD
ncbi:AMP-binding protein [Saccharomonospora glauca]|uniref:Acyl-CoA synthetase (AMP-forming)/AMP-acid ligase II n=1 Tax=Saccharomonospora glauca K62 TaxID=928724 RepID=I1D3R7_9PSEU|nr:AMP-binding protein [Saccharomonospora glauca]EIE99591.1 acyl-CoA synthetase (AMP-forming)/AMP-acid ligase II [Saccharomonospora glauca K62]